MIDIPLKVLIVEDGVNDIGGLQGDWQRIHFTAKSFTRAAIRAVDDIATGSGLVEAGTLVFRVRSYPTHTLRTSYLLHVLP